MRKKIFTRQITVEVYEEDNSTVSIEGSVLDTMPLDAGYFKVGRRPSDPRPLGVLHGLNARWVVSKETREILQSEGSFPNPAFPGCPAFLPRMRDLKGLRLGRGFTTEMMRRLGGALGCEHMTSLLVSMLRAPHGAYYFSLDRRAERFRQRDAGGPVSRDGVAQDYMGPDLRCHMHRPGGPVEQATARGINVFTEDW
jgi:hypothetical protein